MNETEKSKRKEKPKGAPRRKWLLMTAAGALVMAGILVYAYVLPACACSPIETTATSIAMTNAEVAVLLTQTKFADLQNTSGPEPEYYWTQTAEVRATGTAHEVNRQIRQTATALGNFSSVGGSATPTLDGSAEPSPPPGLTATKVCFWNRATQNDAEFAQRMATVLDEAGIEVVAVTVSAHGEDYICNEDGRQTKSFHPMDWSPAVSIPEIRDETPAAMGARIERVLRAIEAMNAGGLYRIELIFASTGTESILWRMDYKAALQALNSGITGAALYEAGRGG